MELLKTMKFLIIIKRLYFKNLCLCWNKNIST